MSTPIPTSATLEPGNAAVFVDVENLFKPFRRYVDFTSAHLPEHRRRNFEAGVSKARNAAQQMAPDLDYDDVHSRGAEVAMRLVQWFGHKGFTVAENHGRTYGQLFDPGVESAWRTFVEEMNWNHTLTRRGEDRADRALLTDVSSFAAKDLDWIFVGSSDLKLILTKSGELLQERPNMHLAAILLGRTSTTDRAFRHSPQLARFNVRLFLWRIYHEVLSIEKQRTWSRREPSPQVTAKRNLRSARKAARTDQDKRKHADRIARIKSWVDLDDAAAADAARSVFCTIAEPESLGTATTRYIAAARELSDEVERQCMLDLIGTLYQEQLNALTSAKSV